jgi:hypothetical protein
MYYYLALLHVSLSWDFGLLGKRNITPKTQMTQIHIIRALLQSQRSFSFSIYLLSVLFVLYSPLAVMDSLEASSRSDDRGCQLCNIFERVFYLGIPTSRYPSSVLPSEATFNQLSFGICYIIWRSSLNVTGNIEDDFFGTLLQFHSDIGVISRLFNFRFEFTESI